MNLSKRIFKDGDEKDGDKVDSEEDGNELKIDSLDTTNVIDTPVENKIRERIQFNDIDNAISTTNEIEEIQAPKSVERLEQIGNERHEARKLEEADDDEDEKLKIGEKINLTELDVHDLEKPKILNKLPIGLEEIEILT